MFYLIPPIQLHKLTHVYLAASWSKWVVLYMKVYMIRIHPMLMKMASAETLWARYAGYV